MNKTDDLVKALKKVNLVVNQLKDYVVMLTYELDKKKIINKKSFDKKYQDKVNKYYNFKNING